MCRHGKLSSFSVYPFTERPSLASNSWVQRIPPPQPARHLGPQTWDCSTTQSSMSRRAGSQPEPGTQQAQGRHLMSLRSLGYVVRLCHKKVDTGAGEEAPQLRALCVLQRTQV